MSYTEIVDTVETPDGMTFRALLIADEYAEAPENDGGCPIVRIDYTHRDGYWSPEMTGYGDGFPDGLPMSAAEIIARFNIYDKRTAIDTFERYLRIFHDGNLVEYGPNQGTDSTYVAYVTRTLWEAWGNDGPVGQAEMDEYRAWIEGQVYGITVESRPTVELDSMPSIRPWSDSVDRDGWTEHPDYPIWGFYGAEYAEIAAREELADVAADHVKLDRETTLFQPEFHKARLEYLRGEIEAERISYSELAELQSMAEYIDKGDVQLLEWAGVPEFPEDPEA